MRRWLLFVHRWLGLTAGIFFAIASFTGGILVYQDELDTLIGGPRFRTTPGLIDIEQLEVAIRQARPGAELVRVMWPTEAANTFSVRVTAGGRQQDLVFDAGSGTRLQPRPLHLALQALRRLHTSVLIGPIGSRVVLYASGASVISLAIGLWLWWPGIRRLTQGLKIRLRRDLYVMCFDLHQVLGLLALPLLLVMTVTGVLLNQSVFSLASQLMNGDDVVRSWAALRSNSSSESTAPGIGLSDAVRRARAGDDRAAVKRVEFPTTPEGVIAVWMNDETGATERTIRVALDRYTGATLARQRLLYDADTNSRLHFGLIGGPVVRLLYSVSCFVGATLLPTGIVVWWIKRRRRARPQGNTSRPVQRVTA
jgi:uncharacterized iron-regulated membrane protein